MPDDRRSLWDQRHRDAADVGTVPRLLRDFADWLPATGRALDLACGRGAAALWLAERGLDVTAFDYSTVAIDRVAREAAMRGLTVHAEVTDVLDRPLPLQTFDLIVVSHFLERRLCAAIAGALRPGGLLCYQTFGPAVPGDRGPSNPAFRLQAGELMSLFPTLDVCAYLEPGERAPVGDERRGLAMLMACNPG